MLKFLGLNCDIIYFYFYKSPCYCYYSAKIFITLTRIFLAYFWQNSCWFFCRIMSTISSQRQVRQRTEEEQSPFQAKIMDCNVLAEWNVASKRYSHVVRTDALEHWVFLNYEERPDDLPLRPDG